MNVLNSDGFAYEDIVFMELDEFEISLFLEIFVLMVFFKDKVC